MQRTSTAPGAGGILELANAIFAKRGARVMELESGLDCLPIEFLTATSLAEYVRRALRTAAARAQLVVHYPDMGGRPLLERVELDPALVPGHTHRYTWSGLGLIHVQLAADAPAHVTANALAHPDEHADSDRSSGSGDWDLAAVQRHEKRLQRVLRQVA
jgi:hypothetical protein